MNLPFLVCLSFWDCIRNCADGRESGSSAIAILKGFSDEPLFASIPFPNKINVE